MLKTVFLVATIAPLCGANLPASAFGQPAIGHTLAARKTVNVTADNEASAMGIAESQNKGWRSVKVKKTGSDKSRTYAVTMEKE